MCRVSEIFLPFVLAFTGRKGADSSRLKSLKMENDCSVIQCSSCSFDTQTNTHTHTENKSYSNSGVAQAWPLGAPGFMTVAAERTVQPWLQLSACRSSHCACVCVCL